MRLSLLPVPKQAHQQLASGVGWAAAGQLLTSSDDQTLHRWSGGGEPQGTVCKLDAHVADLHCCPAGARQAGNDVVAAACTDGTLKLIAGNGRLEKSVAAHGGAVLCVRWSSDGSSLATGGEDGCVKVWSRAGMLRSTLAQLDEPARCVAWGGGADASQLLVCSGCCVSIRSVQGAAGGGGSQASWAAHDGLVLAADWSSSSNLIVTGGEDCRYKVWDAYGRLLFASRPWEHSITSVAWSPDGSSFAAGSFNCLELCDQQGGACSQVRPAASGSLLAAAWSPDGTCLAAAGSSGSLVLAALLGLAVEDGHVAAELEGRCAVGVVDMLNEAREQLEFREPVVKLSLGFGHLVVTTASQAHVFSTSNLNTPHILPLREQPHLLLQCGRGFALLDASAGVQVFTYEGRPVCSIKPPGLRVDCLGRCQASLSNDTLALAAGSSVRCYETAQGRPVGAPISHTTDVRAVALSQSGTVADRMLALLDADSNLHLLKVLGTSSSSGPQQQQQSQQSQQALVKLAGNVPGPPLWHDAAPMLAALVDSALLVWHHPGAAWVDRDLLAAACSTIKDGLPNPGTSLALFAGGSLLLQRRDGARVLAAAPQQQLLLHSLVAHSKWDRALRLARFSSDATLWACLAGMAMAAGQLDAAEAAFAAIDAVDKLQFVHRLRGMSAGGGGGSKAAAAAATRGAGSGSGSSASNVLVAAELALYRRQPDEAEALLLQAGLVRRAIKLRVRMHSWQRALALATKHQQHVDTVLMYRRRHLAAAGLQEVLPEFAALAQQVVDEGVIRERIAQEKAAEATQLLGGPAASTAVRTQRH